MNFTLKLAYQYKLTEKKIFIYMHLLLLSIVLCGFNTRTSRKKKIDSSKISSVYIISIDKKRLCTCMHIVIYIYASVRMRKRGIQ